MTIMTLPISAGSTYPYPGAGGSESIGAQAYGRNGELLTWSGSSWQQFSSAQAAAVQAMMSTPGIAPRVCTVATLGAASLYVGGAALVSDIGSNTVLSSDGSRWRPRGGIAVLKMLRTRATMTGTTETVLFSVPLPWSADTGCLLRDGDSVQVWTPMSKSATSETVTVRFRAGPLGTIADTQVITSGGFVGTTSVSVGVVTDLIRISATSLQKAGHALPANSWIGSSTTAYPSAVTVSNMDSEQPIVSFTSQSSAASETIALELGARAFWIAAT